MNKNTQINICEVCEASKGSIGFHYGVIICEACKVSLSFCFSIKYY